MKGIELGTPASRMGRVIADITGGSPNRIAVISGPNLAREIAERRARRDRRRLRGRHARPQGSSRNPSTEYFISYTNPDVIGCRLGGAVEERDHAGGWDDGRHRLRRHARATLITRGLAQVAELGAALGAKPRAGSRAWPGSVTSSPPAVPRCRGTTRSAEMLGRGIAVADVAASATPGHREGHVGRTDPGTGPEPRRGDSHRRGGGRGSVKRRSPSARPRCCSAFTLGRTGSVMASDQPQPTGPSSDTRAVHLPPAPVPVQQPLGAPVYRTTAFSVLLQRRVRRAGEKRDGELRLTV